jgi:hypothetical protein
MFHTIYMNQGERSLTYIKGVYFFMKKLREKNLKSWELIESISE